MTSVDREGLKAVSGGRWTTDGRWVVVGSWLGSDRIIFDPGNGHPFLDIWDCHAFIKENR